MRYYLKVKLAHVGIDPVQALQGVVSVEGSLPLPGGMVEIMISSPLNNIHQLSMLIEELFQHQGNRFELVAIQNPPSPWIDLQALKAAKYQRSVPQSPSTRTYPEIDINTMSSTRSRKAPGLEPEGAQVVRDNLEQQIEQKFTLHPSVQNLPKEEAKCQQVKEKLLKVKEDLALPLQDPDFSITCMREEEFIKQNHGQTSILASVLPSETGYTLKVSNTERVDEALLKHESRHASVMFLHKQEPCQVKDKQDAFVPVPVVTPKNIAAYHRLLDEGDAEVRKFGKLRMMKREGTSLTKKQAEKLEEYNEAIKSCTPRAYKTPIDERTYNAIRDSNGKISRLTNGGSGEQVDVVSVFKEKNNYFAFFKSADPGHFIASLPTMVENAQRDPAYAGQTPGMMLAEREANTFQSLSPAAEKLFYKRAHEHRKKFTETCIPNTEDNQKKLTK